MNPFAFKLTKGVKLMRITNTIITSQYKRNLNQSLNRLNYFNQRATTYRKFDSASEDPIGASKAYSLRKSYNSNTDYLTNLKDIDNMMLTAESAMTNLNKIAQEVGSSDIMQAINGTMSKEDRAIVATKLRKMQEAMVSEMNAKYGDQFLFSGNDIGSPPFTIGQDGSLLYKGVDVTTGEHAGFEGKSAQTLFNGANIDLGKKNGDALNGYTLNVISKTASETDSIDNNLKVINIYLDPADLNSTKLQDSLNTLLDGKTINGTTIQGDQISVSGTPSRFGSSEITSGENPIAKGTIFNLDDIANEKKFIDIGLGLSMDNNNGLNEQSVFDASLPGISFLGYGKNPDGTPNNMYVLLGQVADGLESGTYDYDKLSPMINNFAKQTQNLLGKITEFGSKSNFLDYTLNRLEDTEYNLNVKIKNVEYVEPQDAIMDFKMQEYAYMAALQMGTKLIQPTFLDYMR